MQFEDFKGKIILSADVTLDEVLSLVSQDRFPRDEVAVKLDRLFLTRYGLNAIDKVQSCGVPVFADAKIVEIPSKTMGIVDQHLEYRPWMLNVMAGIASTGITPQEVGVDEQQYDALFHFAKRCAEAGTKSCIVTVLTSKSPGLVQNEYRTDVGQAVLGYVELGLACGITDIVCAPTDIAFIRQQISLEQYDYCLNTPGVRLPTSSKDDQQRVMSPSKALQAGADRLVIGRDLTKGDFFENFARIKADIDQHLQT